MSIFLKEKYIDVYDNSFNLNNSIKNLVDIANKIDILTAKYKPDKEIEPDDRKKELLVF